MNECTFKKMQLTSPYGQLTLVPYNTNHDTGPLLPGAHSWFGEDRAGTILLHEYCRSAFTIRLVKWSIQKKGAFQLTAPFGDMVASFALQGAYHFSFGKGLLHICRESQYIYQHQPESLLTWHFEKGKVYTQLQVCFSPQLIDYYREALQLPYVETVQDVPSNISSSGWINVHMNAALQHLLNNQYTENVRDFFYENKVRDLLFQLLADDTDNHRLSQELSTSEIEALHKAKNLIAANLQKHISIAKLSRQVHLNEFKLKIGFKQLFGMGPFGFLKEARMKQAHELLLHTDKPIKEVAAIAGYASLSSFVGAFRKHFGYTPGQLRYK